MSCLVHALFHLSLKGTSHYGRRLSGQGILAIWLVESQSLSAGPSLWRPTANGQRPPKCLYGSIFWKFWRQKFVHLRRVWVSINIADKFSSTRQTFLSKLIQSLQFIILMDFYLVLLKEVFPRSSQPHLRSMKHPSYSPHSLSLLCITTK
jgi:hypothetical protein